MKILTIIISKNYKNEKLLRSNTNLINITINKNNSIKQKYI